MPRLHAPAAPFRKTLLALAASAALAPPSLWAIDLVQAPPGTVQPYVTPNVIISVDDSGSMGNRLDSESSSNVSSRTSPDLAGGGWSMNSKRINVLKYALKGIFDPSSPSYDPALLPDKKIRLAWQVMHNNGGASDAKNVNSTTMNTNSMRSLEGQHRTNFLSFVSGLSPNNGTPSHLMFKQADEYMRQPLGTNSVWASKPGTTGAPYLGCRRNYHIMMTDGRWNNTSYDVGDTTRRDNATNITLPDGTVYGGTTAAEIAKTALYRDKFTKTLADWAFYSWATPLQTSGLTGNPDPAADYRKAPTTENFGKDSANKDAILDRFWNPRYNPATWPHMVTYTIGFSAMATTWPGAPTIIAPTSMVPFGYDGSFQDLVTGNKTWPAMDNENKRSLDLWHAALNGRGRYYAIAKGEDLELAFRQIFQQINTQTDPDMTSTATSGSNTSRNDVGKYTGAYEPKNAWKGFVIAETVKKDGTTEPASGWGGKNTAFKLDEASFSVADRLVLTWSDEWKTSAEKGGTAFKWNNAQTYLSTGQKYWLGLATSASGVTTKTNGQNVVNFVRGDRTLEGSESNGYTAAKPFRERQSRQGDIVNSVVWYTGAPVSAYNLAGYGAFTKSNRNRQTMIYVGGNDGMLHGFSATDGTELIAYVPRGTIPQLTRLSNPSYNNSHRFFVDGSPMTGDVDMGAGVQDPADPNYSPSYTSDWRTLLVGTLGAGGKGYFVLDVTNPTGATGSAPKFEEAKANELVIMDRTRSVEDVGYAPLCQTMTSTAKTTCETESKTPPDCSVFTNTLQKSACQVANTEDRDIGQITARPVIDEINSMRTTQITRMNNNRWAVVLGNGYNSSNQRPVLLIQYLDGQKELLRIPVTGTAALAPTPGTGLSKDNGLMAPRLVDINGDDRPEIAYAGDNMGNLWKFDLTNVDDSQWKVAFGGLPLFTATGPASLGSASRTVAQSFTVAPTARPNDRKKTVGTGPTAKEVDVGGMMVSFGTGRNVTKLDESDNNVQTIYSVLDNTRYRTVSTSKGKRLEVHPGGGTCSPIPMPDCAPTPTTLGSGVTNAKLVERTIDELDGGKSGAIDDSNTLDWKVHNGWYMDLPAVGERLLKPLEFYDGTNILAIYSQVPAKGSDVDPNVESCDASTVDEERQYRTFVNAMDGKKPSVQLVDVNGDGAFDAGDNNVSRRQVAKGAHNLISSGHKTEDIDVKNNREQLARMPEESQRPGWRQLR